MLATVLLGLATAAPPISVSYTTVVDHHVSELMSVFLSDDLNHEWSPTLDSHRLVYTPEGKPLAHQQYRLPWPLAPRDVLLSCERKQNHREAVLTSECHSVESDAAPIREGVVRLELERTAWRIEALPDERTRLTLELTMPAKNTAGVPKYVVKYCQTRSLKDSIAELVAAVSRLQLPPHEGFVKWKRSRAAAAAAMRRVPRVELSVLARAAEAAAEAGMPLAAVAGAIAVLLAAHALAFAALAPLCSSSSRRRRTRGLATDGRAPSPTSVLEDEQHLRVQTTPRDANEASVPHRCSLPTKVASSMSRVEAAWRWQQARRATPKAR